MMEVEQLKQTMELMGINRVVVIDDKLNIDQQTIIDILNGQFDTPDFNIRLFVETLGYLIDDLKENEQFPPLLVKKISEHFPGVIKSEISELLVILSQIFEKESIFLFECVQPGLIIDSNTLLFLDYKIEGSQTSSEQFAHILAEKSTTDLNPRCIVFISNNNYFSIETERYDMFDYKRRTEYFRALRGTQTENYKNTVYDYISKGKMVTESDTYGELYKVFQNLYGSRKFFELLNCMEEILNKSSQAVMGKFHLLNARSIQDMIKEKVVEEGISAPTFLIQWISRHIAKKVEQHKETGNKVDRILREINEWTESYYETHEDIVLREILLSEMWEEVNERYLPVDFGDIYEIDYNNEKRRAILLTQTCTLAVRNNGKRTGRVAMLALEDKDKLGRKSAITLDDWKGEKITFDLDETVSIPISFLDLTSLNSDGKAVLNWVAGTPPFSCPDNVLWSEGYKLMMSEFTQETAEKLIRNNTRPMHQIDETYMPFTNESTSQAHKYEFPIKRLRRLDQQYSLYVFQSAQSWWGRIGLPVNVNFMDDYKETEGTINAHGAEYQCSFYIKRRLNDIVDVGISLDDFSRILGSIYEDDAPFIEALQPVLTKPELAHLHFTSGKKILSLKLNKTGLGFLASNKIYVKLVSENPCKVDLKVGKVSRYILDGDDISISVVDFVTDLSGSITLKVKKSLLEERKLTSYIERIEYKTNEIDGYGQVVTLSRKDKIFEYIIEKNLLRLHISLERLHQESAATAEIVHPVEDI
ncbi:hypothetical protein [Paenibacillus sp. LPE1-1-1.1]|uniref:hypothetical protein n=1 Tax=Paenibacillus sp. LPE1-1-1.1 TaxID=3135230 RepID=UPI003434382A